MTHFTIAITSDTICPWCYIGSRRLYRAIEIYRKTLSSADTFEVTWHPYYLDQSTTSSTTTSPSKSTEAKSVSMNDRMITKNGAEMASGIRQRLIRTGVQEGIVFNFEGKIGNTRLSHRLIDYARRRDAKGVAEMQNAVAQEIFRRVFEMGGDVTDLEMLIDAAVTVGMDGDDVRRYLEGDEGAEKIDRVASEARNRGVKGVPFVEVEIDGGGGKRVVDGAVDVGEWMEVFRELKEDGSGSAELFVARGV